MRKIVVIALFLAVSLFTTAQQRIIGGSAVDISQQPYQAAIFINGIFNGGGKKQIFKAVNNTFLHVFADVAAF